MLSILCYSIAMVTCDGRFPALEYEVEHKLCTVSPAYADGTYLKFNGPLYFRKGLEKLFSFLETRVIAKNVVGWISGPPGSGKSTSSFAFAMTIDRSTWKVSYLCCSMIGASSFVHFKEDKKSKVLLTNAKDLDNILTRLSLQLKLSQRKHILFADGVCISKSTSQVVVELLRVCTIWYQNDTDHRRLVFISSMAGRSNFQTNFQEIEMEKFTLFSWTLDEYRSAIAVNGVWESIKDNAMADCHIYSSTSTADKAPTKDDLLVSKYHFAGGSCRFMFQKSTEQVILSIYDAIDKVSDFQSYVENNIGDCSVGVVNNLYGRYEGQESVIISAFALASIAIKRGPQLIKQIIDITNAKNNPSLHGQLLECWFFLSIRNGGIDLLDRNNNQTEHWDQCTAFIDLDPNTVILSPEPAWYRPIRWCQEGYDAVYVDPKKNLTRFVQVTKASSHSFNICYFYNLLQHFSEQNETKTLDICFLTPVDEMQNFKITPVYGEGLLHAFAGWKKGCEIQSARVLGAKDFRSFC